MDKYKGLFITVEGIDGSGKTTLITGLVKKLQKEFSTLNILSTREPGGNTIAEKIREIILDINHTNLDSKTEALLYTAARRQHLVDNLIPALNDGAIIICDRFIDSSLAYQGESRKLGINNILNINEFAIDGYYPDITFYIDIPVQVGHKRIHQYRSNEINRLDLENIAFHEAVKKGYDKVNELYHDRVITLDGMKSSEQLIEECFSILISRYASYFKK